MIKGKHHCLLQLDPRTKILLLLVANILLFFWQFIRHNLHLYGCIGNGAFVIWVLQIAFGIWCHWNTFYKYQLLDFSDCPQSIHHDIFHICELYPENVSLLDVRCLADFHNIIARCCIGNEKMPFSTKVDYHSFRDDTLFPGNF